MIECTEYAPAVSACTLTVFCANAKINAFQTSRLAVTHRSLSFYSPLSAVWPTETGALKVASSRIVRLMFN